MEESKRNCFEVFFLCVQKRGKLIAEECRGFGKEYVYVCLCWMG
jgi:hypothetical protein